MLVSLVPWKTVSRSYSACCVNSSNFFTPVGTINFKVTHEYTYIMGQTNLVFINHLLVKFKTSFLTTTPSRFSNDRNRFLLVHYDIVVGRPFGSGVTWLDIDCKLISITPGPSMIHVSTFDARIEIYARVSATDQTRFPTFNLRLLAPIPTETRLFSSFFHGKLRFPISI